jgi:hypothetical protein
MGHRHAQLTLPAQSLGSGVANWRIRPLSKCSRNGINLRGQETFSEAGVHVSWWFVLISLFMFPTRSFLGDGAGSIEAHVSTSTDVAQWFSFYPLPLHLC